MKISVYQIHVIQMPIVLIPLDHIYVNVTMDILEMVGIVLIYKNVIVVPVMQMQTALIQMVRMDALVIQDTLVMAGIVQVKFYHGLQSLKFLYLLIKVFLVI